MKMHQKIKPILDSAAIRSAILDVLSSTEGRKFENIEKPFWFTLENDPGNHFRECFYNVVQLAFIYLLTTFSEYRWEGRSLVQRDAVLAFIVKG